MARYTGPKHKLARREGVNILEKQSGSLERRLNILPGAHLHRGRRSKPSEYGIELREKQKAKRLYGVLERQFRKYYRQALKKRGAASEALLAILETRLDNILYRLHLAPTRFMARQLIVHGHVRVNNQKLDRPSYNVQKDDTISLSEKAMKIPTVSKLLEEKKLILPTYLKRDGPIGQLLHTPARDEIIVPIDEKLIMEYYSR